VANIAAPEVHSWRVKYGKEAAPEIYRGAFADRTFYDSRRHQAGFRGQRTNSVAHYVSPMQLLAEINRSLVLQLRKSMEHLRDEGALRRMWPSVGGDCMSRVQ